MSPMKVFAEAAILCAAFVPRARAGAVMYGPAHCVSLSRSAAGTCVIATDCEGQELSQFDFSFDCENEKDGSVVRHSFGKGGFDANEEFDTEVTCDRCTAPAPPEDPGQGSPAPQRPQPSASAVTTGAGVREAASAGKKRPTDPPPRPEPPGRVQMGALKEAKVAKERSDKEKALRKWHEDIEENMQKVGKDMEEGMEDVGKDVQQSNENLGEEFEKGTKDTQRRSEQEMKKWGADDDDRRSDSQDDRQDKAQTSQSEERAVVSYGPRGCISTYRSEEGHCIMKTNCRPVDIRDYNFGLVCVDTDQVPVRHLFGKDSFDPQETFDTLIKCEQCLGLEDVPDNIAMNGQVVALAEEITGLNKMAKDISSNIVKLNQRVFPNQAYYAAQDNGTAYGSGPTYYGNQAAGQAYGNEAAYAPGNQPSPYAQPAQPQPQPQPQAQYAPGNQPPPPYAGPAQPQPQPQPQGQYAQGNQPPPYAGPAQPQPQPQPQPQGQYTPGSQPPPGQYAYAQEFLQRNKRGLSSSTSASSSGSLRVSKAAARKASLGRKARVTTSEDTALEPDDARAAPESSSDDAAVATSASEPAESDPPSKDDAGNDGDGDFGDGFDD